MAWIEYWNSYKIRTECKRTWMKKNMNGKERTNAFKMETTKDDHVIFFVGILIQKLNYWFQFKLSFLSFKKFTLIFKNIQKKIIRIFFNGKIEYASRGKEKKNNAYHFDKFLINFFFTKHTKKWDKTSTKTANVALLMQKDHTVT